MKYLLEKFPSLSEAKIKEGFVDPQIRTLMKNTDFEKIMTEVERKAWISYKKVVNGFLGNTKNKNYKHLVTNMLNNFKELGCNMSLKVHFLHYHLDFFPENLEDKSEEQGERFH